MMDWLTSMRWSPYAVGIGIGVLSWFTMLISRKPLGCSTSFARTAGMIEKAFRGPQVELKPYYQKTKPVIDWQWMMVLGIVIGSCISSLLSGAFDLQWVPSVWAATFGTAVVPRLIVALLGGVIIGFGSRWAGGCTSGHGISGTMQLAVSGWISAICFFIGGIIAAYLLFGRLG
jgi:uncharacterized protein